MDISWVSIQHWEAYSTQAMLFCPDVDFYYQTDLGRILDIQDWNKFAYSSESCTCSGKSCTCWNRSWTSILFIWIWKSVWSFDTPFKLLQNSVNKCLKRFWQFPNSNNFSTSALKNVRKYSDYLQFWQISDLTLKKFDGESFDSFDIFRFW